MVVEQGQRFTLRDGAVTVGTGVITAIKEDLSSVEKAKIAKGKSRREREAAHEKYAKLLEDLPTA